MHCLCLCLFCLFLTGNFFITGWVEFGRFLHRTSATRECIAHYGKTTKLDHHPNPTTNPNRNPHLVAVRESLPNRYRALSLAHVCACVTGLQHSELYRFGRFAAVRYGSLACITDLFFHYWESGICKHHFRPPGMRQCMTSDALIKAV